MGRPPRAYCEGIYHIAGHGSDDRDLFLDDADRRAFLEHLDLTFTPLGLDVISYVLMTNHYHTLVATPDARIETGLQGLHGGYSLKHNKRHGRSAHLFKAHCLARRIEDNDDLLWTARYIARNPVEAGLVLNPVDWPWSSARAHAGLMRPAIRLVEAPLRDAFGDKPDWRRRYRQYVENDEGPHEQAFDLAGTGSSSR
jgi:REP element-mobilizing transposase RayT